MTLIEQEVDQPSEAFEAICFAALDGQESPEIAIEFGADARNRKKLVALLFSRLNYGTDWRNRSEIHTGITPVSKPCCLRLFSNPHFRE